MNSVGKVIKKMKQVLYHEKLPRITALRGLQMEEQGDPFKILIGTILSSRTRDEKTTKVVNSLFRRFKNAKELAEVDVDDIKTIIHRYWFLQCQS